MSLKAWSSICLPKGEGGLGIRRTTEVNQALIAKLAWKMITEKESLWVRLLNGKYLKGRNFWQVGASGNSSWIWKSIVRTREVLKVEMCYQVGLGQEILLQSDPWVLLVPGFIPCLREEGDGLPSGTAVRELLLDDGCSWNSAEVRRVFSQASANEILKVKVAGAGVKDKLFWTSEASGDFFVKSMHRALVGQRAGGTSILSSSEWRDI